MATETDRRSGTAQPTQPRPYRSKRHRPCDVCRRRKHACFFEDQPPCKVCLEMGTDCTFNDPPTKRRRKTQLPQSPSTPSQSEDPAGNTEEFNDDQASQEWQPVQQNPNDGPDDATATCNFAPLDESLANDMLQPSSHDMWYATSGIFDQELGALSLAFVEGLGEVNYAQEGLFPVPNQFPLPTAPEYDVGFNHTNNAHQSTDLANPVVQAQPVKALDSQGSSTSIQYFGPSGEMDPYLLQHMRFSDEGSCNFGQFQYRSLLPISPSTGVNPSAKDREPPVHFMISSPKHPSDRGGPEGYDEYEQRAKLNALVDPELGTRHVGLFLRYVFPSLPVISRSRLNVRTMTLIPKAQVLETLPPYLLAAIYASADFFRRYDPTLNVSQTDAKFPKAALWKMAFQGISQNMHTSQLAVIQALLIYLQRPMEEAISASSESPGQWSLLGNAVQLAHQIGLHRDCRLWPIPEWEKRLRRRLWWVVYSESVWRSLLLGMPQLVHADQWDVDLLDTEDFSIENLQCPTEETSTQAPALQKPCVFCHAAHEFRFLADLTIISYDIYYSFFTLTATKRLAGNFEASLGVGKTFLERLDKWHGQLPKTMTIDASPDPDNRDYFHAGSAAHLKLSFISLKALVYRAMLRPLAHHSRQELSRPHAERSNAQGDTALGDSLMDTPASNTSALDLGSRVVVDALVLVRQAVRYTQRLGSYDCNSFSRSWSRACFATLSNLIMLLLVLAPDSPSAKEILSVLARWVIILREQSAMFKDMQLGLLRLDAVFRTGLENAFRFPAHVQQSVQRELPTRSYQK